jgi:hypothetical protein
MTVVLYQSAKTITDRPLSTSLRSLLIWRKENNQNRNSQQLLYSKINRQKVYEKKIPLKKELYPNQLSNYDDGQDGPFV